MKSAFQTKERRHLLKSGTVEVSAGRAVVDVGVIDADLGILLQILSNNHLLRVDGFAVGIFALHGEADINGGVTGHVDFGCSHGVCPKFCVNTEMRCK